MQGRGRSKMSDSQHRDSAAWISRPPDPGVSELCAFYRQKGPLHNLASRIPILSCATESDANIHSKAVYRVADVGGTSWSRVRDDIGASLRSPAVARAV